MYSSAIEFRSYTDAMKSEKILRENGINTSYGKSTDYLKGCIHILNVRSDPEKALRILNNKGIICSVQICSVKTGGIQK